MFLMITKVVNINGNLTLVSTLRKSLINWDTKLRYADAGQQTVELKYDPMGNSVWRKSTPPNTYRKYVADIAGSTPSTSSGQAGDANLDWDWVAIEGL
jgi:hypothetical protein